MPDPPSDTSDEKCGYLKGRYNHHLDFKCEFPKESKEWHREYRRHIKECHPDEWKRRNDLAKIRAKQRYKAMNVENNPKERFIIEHGGKCSMCGIKYTGENIAIFDLHHSGDIKSTKTPSQKMRTNKPTLQFEEELKGCTVLCSNCHRLLHHNLKETTKYFKPF